MSDTAPSPTGAPRGAPSGLKRPPPVARIGMADLTAAWRAGLADFRRAPLLGLFFGSVYAVGGGLLVALVTVLEMPWLAYPLMVGFALVGPFVAVGLYEVSRRLEAGTRLTWGGVLGVVLAQRRRELAWMAFVMLFVLIAWMYQVRLLLALFLGFQSFSSFQDFLTTLVTTSEGLTFLAVGHAVGAALAFALFAITVVAVPMLLDREVDVVTAMITSVNAVKASPGPMLAWGLFVLALVLLACVPAFLGLLVVLPVLGHATWHLYRRVVGQG